jgi:DNA-binding NtrC family response regulator
MKSPRIIAIDDEQVVLDSIVRVLAAEGMAVEATVSAREGLSRAVAEPYDLVLSDIRMPEIGGMRILRDVKRAKPALPVVIITGFATVGSAVQAMKLGAADYVEKPFTPDVLLAAVRAALAGGRAPEPQGMVHRDEVLRVLERAGTDSAFVADIFYSGVDALEGYTLTGPEKLAILTGDLRWIEEHVGALAPVQRRWLEQKLSAEVW